MKKNKVKIIFFGTSEFAVPALEALIKEGHDVVAVITTPDEPVGRKQTLTPPPLKLKAQNEKLKIFQPEKLKGNSELVSCLLSLAPDIGIVAAYGKIIPKEIIDLPKHGLINIHPSLLPKYRGPAPIQSALLNGDEQTGVTILKVDEEMDHGPTIKNQKLKIKNQNYKELEEELAKLGAELLIKILPEYLAGKIKPKEQGHSQASFTKKFTWQDGKIDWNKPAREIFNKIRALNPEPGTWTTIKPSGKILKITSASLDTGKSAIAAGSALIRDGQLRISALDGQIIPEIVQLESKQKLKIGDFLRGLKLQTGRLDFE